MAWTYSGNPATAAKDAVRFLVGDTKSDIALVTDEEIAYALSFHTNHVYKAAVMVAEGISAFLATQATMTEIGPIREEYTTRSEAYAKIAQALAIRANTQVVFGSLMGESSELSENRNAVFEIGMHDLLTTDLTEES